MITINLMPHERRRARAPMLLRALSVFLTLAIVGGSIAALVYSNFLLNLKSSQLTEIEQEIAQVDEDLQEIWELEDKEELLRKKRGVIEKLIEQRLDWAPKLQSLAELAPESVWLEDVHIETDRIKKKEKVPIPGTGTKGEKQRFRNKTVFIEKQKLVITGVTDDLKNRTAWVAQFISNLEKDDFYGDFDNIDMDEAWIENWVPRDDETPLVWRFQISMNIKKRGADKDQEDEKPSNEALNSA